MNKKRLFTILASSMMGAQFVLSSTVVMAEETSEHLEDLRRQQEELENESSEVESNIQGSRQQMDDLSQEKDQLESDIAGIQANVDELIQEIESRQQEITEKEAEIEQLHSEIDVLKDLIDKRTEKIENQARAVQVSGDANSLVSILLSSESFTDFIDRASLISEIVSSNQNIIGDQKRDQEALEEKQAQAEIEQAELEEVKQELEVSRNNLVNQRLALEDRVSQVTAEYNLSEEDLNALLSRQDEIAAQTSDLDAQVKAEQDRLEEERLERERREREEAERRRREEEERQRQEEQAQREAEEEAQRQREAQERQQAAQAERQAQEEREQEAAQETESQSSQESSSSSSSSNTAQAATSQPAPASQSSGWIRPASGYISSGFGYRIHPIYKTSRFHAGVDYAGSGTIRAAKAGTVTSASYSGGLGYHVRINHGNGMSSVYGHMQPGLHVAPGQSVSQGQSLGIMGSTGTSTGVHLHFEIHQNGRPVNPLNYVN